MCQVSRVKCHMSHVTCHMSHVTSHMSHVLFHMSQFTCHPLLTPTTQQQSLSLLSPRITAVGLFGIKKSQNGMRLWRKKKKLWSEVSRKPESGYFAVAKNRKKQTHTLTDIGESRLNGNHCEKNLFLFGFFFRGGGG